MATDPNSPERLDWLDPLRTLLAALVILQHAAVTYGAPGGWYYRETELSGPWFLVFTLFVATNQAFFMGFFFLLAGYFTPVSWERKGPRRYLADRFLRLGVPLLVYDFLLHPLTLYFLPREGADPGTGFAGFLWTYWKHPSGLGRGPLWFVATLLIFGLGFAAWKTFWKGPCSLDRSRELPGFMGLAAFAGWVGLASFATRLWAPVGWSWDPLNLQLGFFSQYIALFAVGLVAGRSGWLQRWPAARLRASLPAALLLVFVGFPMLFLLGGALSGNTEPFRQGWHWQAMGYALWEQFAGLAIIVSLVVVFRTRYPAPRPVWRELGAASYGAYVLHAPILVGFTVFLRDLNVAPVLKFALTGTVAITLSWTLALLLRQSALVRKVL